LKLLDLRSSPLNPHDTGYVHPGLDDLVVSTVVVPEPPDKFSVREQELLALNGLPSL